MSDIELRGIVSIQTFPDEYDFRDETNIEPFISKVLDSGIYSILLSIKDEIKNKEPIEILDLSFISETFYDREKLSDLSEEDVKKHKKIEELMSMDVSDLTVEITDPNAFIKYLEEKNPESIEYVNKVDPKILDSIKALCEPTVKSKSNSPSLKM